MTNWDIFKYTNFILNQDVSGNMIRPEDFDLALRVYSIKHYQALLKKYEEDKIITSSIRRFRELEEVALVNGDGELPEDFRYNSSLTCFFGAEQKVKVDFVTDEEWSDRMTSSFMQPSLRHPIAILTGLNDIKVLPVEIEMVELSYLRSPDTPVFVVSYDSDDNMVYVDDPAANPTSVELDFEYIDKLEIAYMILSDRGINVRDGQIVQYSQFLKEHKEQ